MFGKIYKEAVNECTPNYELKKALILQASKKKKPRTVYKYSLSAAAIIVLIVSVKFAGDIINPLNNKCTEGLTVFDTDQGQTSEAQSAMSVTDDTMPAETVSESETPTPSQTPFGSVAANAKQKENTSGRLQASKKPVQASKQPEEAASAPKLQPSEQPKDNADIYKLDETIKKKPMQETQKVTEDQDKAYDSGMAANISEESVQEPYIMRAVAPEDALISAYAESDEFSEAAYSGGGGGGTASKMALSSETWDTKEYFSYIGINIFEKLKGAVSQQSTKEMVIDENGEPVDDKWTFIYNAEAEQISVTTSKNTSEMVYSGESTEINSVSVYVKENVYRFIYKGVYFEVIGNEYCKNVIKELTSN